MSYCRFFDADAYVYMHVGGWLECAMCSLAADQQAWNYQAYNTKDMIAHLKRHEEAGDNIPEHVYSYLMADDGENFYNVKS